MHTAVHEVAIRLGDILFNGCRIDHQLLVLRTLCDEGANVNLADNRAEEAYILYHLIGNLSPRLPAHVSALKLLLKHGASLSRALHAMRINREFIRVLLDAGADIEELWDNMTPLARAASWRNSDVVQALIDAGANINGAGKPAVFAAIGPVPHYWPSYEPNTTTLITLCNAGADLNTFNAENHSILSYALTLSGYIPDSDKTCDAVLQVLCDAGFDVNLQHRDVSSSFVMDGDGPLHIVTRTTPGLVAECMEILISYGADVNSQNDDGQTPLHAAVHNSDIESARLLLEHGSRLDIKDVHGETPLVLAMSMYHSRMVDLLQKKVNRVKNKRPTCV